MHKLLCVVISFILPLVIAANDLDIEIDEQIIGSKLVKQYEQLASRPLYKNMPCLNEWISHLSETCEPNVPNDFLQKEAARFMECYMKAMGTGGFSCIDGSTEKGKQLSPTRCLLGQGMSEQQLQIWATSFANIKPMCAHFAYAKLHWYTKVWRGLLMFANGDTAVDYIYNSTILRGAISQFVYVSDFKSDFFKFRFASYAISIIGSCLFATFINCTILAMVTSSCFVELFVFLFVSNEYLVALSIRGFFLLMTTILNKKYLARFFLYMLSCKRR